jgi:hypothetical protein
MDVKNSSRYQSLLFRFSRCAPHAPCQGNATHPSKAVTCWCDQKPPSGSLLPASLRLPTCEPAAGGNFGSGSTYQFPFGLSPAFGIRRTLRGAPVDDRQFSITLLRRPRSFGACGILAQATFVWKIHFHGMKYRRQTVWTLWGVHPTCLFRCCPDGWTILEGIFGGRVTPHSIRPDGRVI